MCKGVNNENNKLTIYFNEKCIFINFNHYYISGPSMFIFLNVIADSKPPTFLKTNPLVGLIYLPFYLFELIKLNKKEYVKKKQQNVDLYIEKNICTKNKRFYLYLSILRKVYKSLNLNRPMTAALSIAFEELPFVNNNVGLVIIKFEISDNIEILEKKINNAFYQSYVSNFIINCPMPNFGSFELRNYFDCIISSMYIKSDYKFTIGWNCSKAPLEEIYVGSVSKIYSDNTMDTNIILNSCSSNYNNLENSIENFFDE